MQNDILLTDDYVADLMVKDASDRSLRYSAMGLEAFDSKPKPTNVPKPNTKFLRHIIRDTDAHNRALLAREAAESRARLQDLERTEEAKQRRARPGTGEIRRRQLGNIRSILGGAGAGERRSSDRREKDRPATDGGCGRSKSEKDEEPRRSRRRGDDLVGATTKNRKDYGRLSRRRHDENHIDDEGGQEKFRGRMSGRSHKKDEAGRSSRRRRRRDPKSSGEEEVEDSSSSSSSRRHWHRSKRERSRSPTQCHGVGHRHRRRDRSRSRSQSPPREKRSRPRHRHRSPLSHQDEGKRRKRRTEGREEGGDDEEERGEMMREEKEDDSDPLEELIGPAPPPKYRGRGKVAGAAGMDMRFSEAYDPREDVEMGLDQMGLDEEGRLGQGVSAGGWDDAIEAYRDRQKLRRHRDGRMRAAGYEEHEIRRLGGLRGQGQGQGERERDREMDEGDVVWTKAGEEREWDRGKGDDGLRGIFSEER